MSLTVLGGGIVTLQLPIPSRLSVTLLVLLVLPVLLVDGSDLRTSLHISLTLVL